METMTTAPFAATAPATATACGCQLGERYAEHHEAKAAANAAMEDPHPQELTTKVFACPYGAYFWCWYPAGRKFRRCGCGLISYLSEELAERIAAFHTGRGEDRHVYKCRTNSWHAEPGEDARAEAEAKAARRARRAAEAKLATAPRCRCGKIDAATEAESAQWMELANLVLGETGKPTWFHRCRFKRWHWTTQPQRPTRTQR